jgi:hypothetical protein
MNGRYILNRVGEPVPCPDLFVWARWFEKADRSVDETYVGEVRVSTVFLALDHNHYSGNRPLLWETLVFGGKLDGAMYRYETRHQAVNGHMEMVTRVREAEDA